MRYFIANIFTPGSLALDEYVSQLYWSATEFRLSPDEVEIGTAIVCAFGENCDFFIGIRRKGAETIGLPSDILFSEPGIFHQGYLIFRSLQEIRCWAERVYQAVKEYSELRNL